MDRGPFHSDGSERRDHAIFSGQVTLAIATLSMTALHGLAPELRPLREPLSFYAHGPSGWLLPVSLGSFGWVAVAVAARLPRDAWRLSRFALLGLALGMGIAAVFRCDPWFPWQGPATGSGLAHAIAAVLGPGLLLIPLLDPALRIVASGTVARWCRWIYWSGSMLSVLSLVAGFTRDTFPPWIGLTERVLGAAAVGWFASVLFALRRRGLAR